MASREDEVRAVADELDRLCDRLAASLAPILALLGVNEAQAYEPPPRKEQTGAAG